MAIQRTYYKSHRVDPRSVGAPSATSLVIATAIVIFSFGGDSVQAADGRTTHYRFETQGTQENAGLRAIGTQFVAMSPGDLVSPKALNNAGSWRFDGHGAIVFAEPSNSKGFAEDFTWEGFFLSPSSNSYLSETGIADRLVSQFAFDKGNWTRLAIGLVADGKQRPQLSVELEGFEGRTFDMGDRVVLPDRWHHFALVHEGTAAAAQIRWFLDYQLCGEILLGGQANQNTLRPPGNARITIGARLLDGQRVNRGFDGLIDEVRFSSRPLKVDEFLRTNEVPGSKITDTTNLVARQREKFWKDRHDWARGHAKRWTNERERVVSIDSLIDSRSDPIDDASFLRRLSLVVRGRIPSLHEVKRFLHDRRPDKRVRVIDRFLASNEWADSWVGYWQDVFAENPSVVFPTLNNSGPFRQWIYNSFRDNKPFDRFATELILMEGSEDGPAGFAIATGNDAPMAMRAHVVMKAFAAVDLKCARCHDSPVDDFRQVDLFRLAAYLNDGPLTVPATSVAAIGKASAEGAITTSLSAGQTIEPDGLSSKWLSDSGAETDLRPLTPGRHRAELAALITSPVNSRFSDVIVNRVWKRYFGTALVEPVDQWNELDESSRPEILRVLSSQFVQSGYDLKSLARQILISRAWQSQHNGRQCMSAEQLVDSLFVAVRKEFQAETMDIHATDPGVAHLPQPRRAWQFAALPNERDRPALGMPVNQTIVDVMTTFGWNGSRQQPRSEREETTTALQPLILFNGVMSQRIVRLSDRSAITELCLEDIPVATLVDRLFLTVLSRPPDAEERQRIVDFLRAGYEDRRTGKPARPVPPLSTFQPDWRKHLEAEQTRLMLVAEKRVAQGEPPTEQLTNDFRERVEDVLWALINTPEFVVIP